MKRNPISEASPPNHAVLVTAARVRFGMNVKGSIWAAARDGRRSAAARGVAFHGTLFV